MYSTADAALVSRETAIPGLRLLLDDEHLAAALAARLSGDVKQATTTYLRYKPGTSCIAAVALETATGHHRGFIRAQCRGAVEKVDKQLGHSVRNPADGAYPVLLSCETVYAPLAHDRALPAVRRLRDARHTEELLDRVLPSTLRPEACLSEVRYKAGRRFVARVDGPEGPRAVVKCYADPDYTRAASAAYTIARATGSRVPPPISASKRYRTLAIGWVTGRPLSSLLRQPGVDLATLRAVGAELARLHRADPGNLVMRSVRDDLRALRRSARLVGEILPPLSSQTVRLAARLGGALAAAPRGHACIHGDFSADQVLVDRGGPVIIDFDQAAVGDPVADLGLFAATLEHDVACDLLAGRDAEAAVSALIDGYVAAGGTDPSPTLATWTGAWLVRTLAEPFRFRRPDWAEQMAALLARAESVSTRAS